MDINFFKNNPNPLPQYAYTVLVAIPEVVLQDALIEEKEEAITEVRYIAAKFGQRSYIQLIKDFQSLDKSAKMGAWNALVAERYFNLIKTLRIAGFEVSPKEDVLFKIHHEACAIISDYIQEQGMPDPTLTPNDLPMCVGTIIRLIIACGIVPTMVLNEIVQFSNGLIYSRGAGSGYYETALLKCGAKSVVGVDLPENKYTRAGTVMFPVVTDEEKDVAALQTMAAEGGAVWYNWPSQGATIGYHGLDEAIDILGFRKFVVCGDFSFAWTNPAELASPMFPPTFAKSKSRRWKLIKNMPLIPWSKKVEHCFAWFWELTLI